MSRNFLDAVLAGLIGACALLPSAPARAQSTDPAVAGQWARLPDFPVIPIHMHLLPGGKVALWGRTNTTQGYLWDPAFPASTTPLASAGYDVFCSGHAFLADGRLFVAGGHVVDFTGLAHASLYDPATNTWSTVPDMNAGRWYPTVTALANGDALVVSGLKDQNSGADTLPQVYEAATNTWRNLTAAQLSQDYYPRMFLAPNGRVIEAGPSTSTRWLDTTGAGAWTTIATRTFSGFRDYGSAAMYDGKAFLAGGGDPPTATAEEIDLNVPAPAWRALPSMKNARRHVNATLLPDGTVLVTGGSSGSGFDNQTAPVYATELWNPATGTWTTLASASVPRFYHSSALLLPDGRVLSGGGDNHLEAEAFSPPYLFKGARPSMSGLPAAIGYGQAFRVQSPDAAAIRKVTLIRLGSVTHAFNENQRLNTLQFTAGTGTLDITTPAHANLAPPGHYMLFIVDANGVPSQAGIVRLDSSASPPPPPPPPDPVIPQPSSLSPSSAAAGGPAFTLAVKGSQFQAGAEVRWNGAARVTSFIGADELRAAIPASDIASAGTAQVSVVNPGSAASTNSLPFSVTAAPPPPPPPPPPSTFNLTVTRGGSANTRGTVTSSPTGIDCGSICTAAFAGGATVVLTAKTNGNGVFAGWTGCASVSGTRCTVVLDASKTVTATINRK